MMQSPQSFRLFVVVSGLGLLLWALSWAFRAPEKSVKSHFKAKQDAPAKFARLIRAKQAVQATQDASGGCTFDQFTYPAWPEGFNVSVNALFVIGEQKSGSTWLWELLNGHPCLLTAAQPHLRQGAITTKETYFFTSAKVGTDAREFLIPWMGFERTKALADDVESSIGNDWFEHALRVANVGTATNSVDYYRRRTYTSPNAKLPMQEACKQYYLLEATPHSMNTPVAARRMKELFPKSKAVAVLKEPAWRMHSAYNQFSKPFLQSCSASHPEPWCPVYRYYQLKLPTFAEAVQQELQYLRATGCAFEGESNARSWMSCFGCLNMDPWKHKRDNINNGYPPYAPSAALSMYEAMLKAWTEEFPMEDMRILNYQDLVADPLDMVNHILRFLDLEEYSQTHMEILNPSRLGFKGNYPSAESATLFEGKEILQEFFVPHNRRLDEYLKEHPIPWHPFA